MNSISLSFLVGGEQDGDKGRHDESEQEDHLKLLFRKYSLDPLSGIDPNLAF